VNIKEYISSGIIESYVLGVVSDQERQEVECISHIYPEVLQHLVAMQDELEQLSEGWKKEPPAELKDRVMAAIKAEASNEKAEAKIINLNTAAPKSGVSGQWRLIAAASVLAVLAMGTLFVTKQNQLSTSESQLQALSTDINQKEITMANLETELANYSQEKIFLLHEETIPVDLAGTPNSPDAKVKVFWNEGVNKLVLASNTLPVAPKDLQYQLWAIIDGAPVDLGVIDRFEDKTVFSRDVDVKSVQAFAITLEKNGGSPQPNLEQLYVIGNVGS
jgi:anti-sigma-K factor RskA